MQLYFATGVAGLFRGLLVAHTMLVIAQSIRWGGSARDAVLFTAHIK